MKTVKDILTLKSYSKLIEHFRGVQNMRFLAFLILFIGFIPSFATAVQSEGYLTFIDYVSVVMGFCVGGFLMELRYEH